MNPRIFYDNRLADATPVASTTANGYAVENLTDWRPYTWWKPTALPATVTVDCGAARSADSLFVYGHDLFTQGATIETWGSTDNFSASNVLVDTYTPSSNSAFVRTFQSVSYRYWRIRLTGTTMPSLAIVAIGAMLELAGWCTFDAFDPRGYSIQGQTHRNERGQPLGKVIDFAARSNSVTARRVSWSWLTGTFLPAWDAHLRATPFGFQWHAGFDPVPWLVTAGDDLRTPHYATGEADVSFDINGVVE